MNEMFSPHDTNLVFNVIYALLISLYYTIVLHNPRRDMQL